RRCDPMCITKRGILVLTLVATLLGGPGSPVGAAPGPGAAKDGADRYGDPLPPGTVARLGTVRYRFGGQGPRFLPDSRPGGPVREGNAIYLWDARTGRLLRRIDTVGFTPSWNGFGLSRDGKRLVLSGSIKDDQRPGWRSAAAVFDLTDGKLLRAFEREPREGV